VVDNRILRQSADIARGVDKAERGAWRTDPGSLGAGDQGSMFGYATDEIPELMPLSILTAHHLSAALGELRKTGTLEYLRPDGKSQVTVRYEGDRPVGVERVRVSTMHAEDVTTDELTADLRRHLPGFVPGVDLESATWTIN